MRGTALALVALFSSCSSVEIPEDRFYGLELAAVEAGQPLVSVLRVMDLQAIGACDQDHLVMTDGVRYAPRPEDRWVVSADRLVTDALVLGLSRHGTAKLVLGNADPGLEDWRLHGRLIEFAESVREGGHAARVRVELWLVAGDVLLLRNEFAAEEAVAGEEVEDVVKAFARALDRVLGELVGALRAVDLPGGA